MPKKITQVEHDIKDAEQDMRDFDRTWEITKQAEYNTKIADLKLRRDKLVWRAHKDGVSKAAIARAMGTTARIKVYEILNTDPTSDANTNPPKARLDGDTLILTFKDTPGVTEDLLTGEYQFTRDGQFWDAAELGPVQTKITNLIESDESNPVKDAVERATKEGKS